MFRDSLTTDWKLFGKSVHSVETLEQRMVVVAAAAAAAVASSKSSLEYLCWSPSASHRIGPPCIIGGAPERGRRNVPGSRLGQAKPEQQVRFQNYYSLEHIASFPGTENAPSGASGVYAVHAFPETLRDDQKPCEIDLRIVCRGLDILPRLKAGDSRI